MISVIVFGQQKSKMVDEVQVTPPKFAGINDIAKKFQEEKFESIADYLAKNVQYPEEAIKNKQEGTEVIQFEVTPKGELTNFNVINSVSPEIDEAIINLLKATSGMWMPGQNNGEPVAMENEVSIAFKYGEFEAFSKSKDFMQLAKLLLKKGNHELLVKNNPKKALKYFDRGIRYLPNEDCLLLSRGICKYELGDTEGARHDWLRMSNAGIDNKAEKMASDFIELQGYAELTVFINNK
jgi:TonB family protein